MNTTTRQTIEELRALQALVTTTAWANDTLGELERTAIEIMLGAGISEEDALEWLHEEDE